MKNSPVNQQAGESYDDWKYRLLIGKKNKKYDITWREIAIRLGLTCSPNYARNFASAISAYDEYLKKKHQDGESHADNFDKLDNKIFELQKQKNKMYDQKRMLNTELRNISRTEHLENEMKKAVLTLEKKRPLNIEFKDIKGDSAKEAVLLLSDWHVGMVTDNFQNTYNNTVLRQRVEKLIVSTVSYMHQQGARKINVFSLGDIVNGLIHVTTRINNEEDIVHQCMIAGETLAEMLATLSSFFEVNVFWARGNHERMTPKRQESITRESFSDMILWYLKARLEYNNRIMFVENTMNDEIITTKILGNQIIACHGHKEKLNKTLENLSLMLKIFPDYIFLGHFHSSAEREIQGAEVIVNGSLCGTDDFAVSIRRTAHASQKLLFFSEEGRICTYNIRLD